MAFATSRSKVMATAAQKRLEQAFGGNNSSEGKQSAQSTALSTYGDASRAGSWDIRTEIHGARSSAGSADSDFWVGYVGVHKFVTDDMLIGLMGQLDWAEEDDALPASHAEGMGWMIGPYIAGQIQGQGLTYEARVSYGTSDNDVSPIGTYTDSFDTTRWLASAKVTGSFEHGMFTVNPTASVAWFEETQEAYVDTNGLLIPEQTVSFGEVRFGPSINQEIVLDDGTVFTPSFGVSGVFNFGINKTNVASQGFALGDDDLRARMDAGFTASSPYGLILMISGFYDGIGIKGYDAYGGSARITLPLN